MDSSTPMNIRIERAQPDDAPDLIRIQNLAFDEDYRQYGECPAVNEPEDKMREMIENAFVYKILDGEKLIGDIIVRKRDGGECYLRVLAVIPEYQSQGIGGLAIRHIESDHLEAAAWTLITPEGSARNRHFYEKHGYKMVGKEVVSEKLTLLDYRKDCNVDSKNK